MVDLYNPVESLSRVHYSIKVKTSVLYTNQVQSGFGTNDNSRSCTCHVLCFQGSDWFVTQACELCLLVRKLSQLYRQCHVLSKQRLGLVGKANVRLYP